MKLSVFWLKNLEVRLRLSMNSCRSSTRNLESFKIVSSFEIFVGLRRFNSIYPLPKCGFQEKLNFWATYNKFFLKRMQILDIRELICCDKRQTITAEKTTGTLENIAVKLKNTWVLLDTVGCNYYIGKVLWTVPEILVGCRETDTFGYFHRVVVAHNGGVSC